MHQDGETFFGESTPEQAPTRDRLEFGISVPMPKKQRDTLVQQVCAWFPAIFTSCKATDVNKCHCDMIKKAILSLGIYQFRGRA